MRPLSALVFLLLASVVAGDETILIKNGAGEFYVLAVVDGVPGVPVPLEEWWTIGQIVHTNGDHTPAPKPDAIAKQVDEWADTANGPEARKQFAAAWESVIADVIDTSNNVTLDKAWRHLSAEHAEIIDGLSEEQKAAWGLFLQQVSVLLDDSITAGTYSVATLQSVQKGLTL